VNKQIALSLLQDARDLGLEPDTIVCNAALSACERGGQWEEALLLLREMDCVEGSPPDRVSYNTAIAALSRGGQWRMAVELLDEMPRVVAPPHNTPDAHSFGAAISACGRGGQVGNGLECAGLARPSVPCGSWLKESEAAATSNASKSSAKLSPRNASASGAAPEGGARFTVHLPAAT